MHPEIDQTLRELEALDLGDANFRAKLHALHARLDHLMMTLDVYLPEVKAIRARICANVEAKKIEAKKTGPAVLHVVK